MKEITQPDMPRHMRTEKLGNIQGLIELYEFVKPDKVVEIGCYQGESSEIAAQFCKTLLCVDNWGPGFEGGEGGFDMRMMKFDNFHKLKKTSANACCMFKNYTFDLVYIDAMHDFKNVTDDIEFWYPKVKTGEYIGGHDYDNEHPDVVEAVNKIFEGHEDIMTFSDSSWLVRKD